MMAKISKDWVDAYFQYGVDVKNRRVFLFDDVGADSIGHVIKGLYLMEADVTVAQRESGNIPKIEIFIGSFGGSEYEMFALYDVIRTLESPIHTIAMGKCMSAAPLLVACGNPGHRYATPNTWFMVHQSWEEWGEKRVDSMMKDLRHYQDMGRRWYDLMERHTKRDAKFWRRECEKTGDKYFDAEVAEELGLIDHIWDEQAEDEQTDE
jgi:ATP-dependent Clp endopeptidase proteolytic subunit ClpP